MTISGFGYRTNVAVLFASILTTAAQVCQTDLGLTYGATPKAATGNTSTTVLSSTGNPSGAYVPIRVKSTNSANIGSGATFSVSYDGGSTFPLTGLTPTAGVPIALTGAGAGVSLSWAAGTSVNNDTWDETASAWADQSGNARHYTQATVTKQPIITVGLNGFVGLLFDGADDYFSSSFSPVAPATTPLSSFLVYRLYTYTASGTLIGGTGGSFGPGGVIQSPSGGGVIMFNNAPGPGSSNLALNTWGVLTEYSTGSTSDALQVGAGDTVHTAASAGNNTDPGKTIGGGPAGLNSAKIEVLAIGYQAGVLPGGLRAACLAKYGAIAA